MNVAIAAYCLLTRFKSFGKAGRPWGLSSRRNGGQAQRGSEELFGQTTTSDSAWPGPNHRIHWSRRPGRFQMKSHHRRPSDGCYLAKSAVRSFGAVSAGLIVALICVIGVEGMSAVLHPFPPGIDPTDFEACKAHVARYPAGVLALAVLLWGMTVFVSSWLATRLGTGRHLAHGIVVGSILLAAAVFNMAMLPYPAWFWLNLIVFPVAFLWGAKLAQGKQAKQSPVDDPSAN